MVPELHPRDRSQGGAWCVEVEGVDPALEGAVEGRLTIGNGYLGVRGALEVPVTGSQPALFVAGVYDGQVADLPDSDRKLLSPQRLGYPYARLAPLPFPFGLGLAIDGERFSFAAHDCEVRRTLDLRSGMLEVAAKWTAHGRQLMLRTRRWASLADPHLLLHEVAVDPEDAAEFDAEPFCGDAALAVNYPHLECIDCFMSPQVALVRYRTRASGIEICIACRTLRVPGALLRLVCVLTSRDAPDVRRAALSHLETAGRTAFLAHLHEHENRWTAFWATADIRVPRDEDSERALRFGSYHLRIAASGDERVSVGTRGLSGRGYDGHFLWDAEMFVLPFFVHAEPEQARRLLMYRHGTLDGARRHARELGFEGACFAWESTVTGDDVTPTAVVLKTGGRRIPVVTGTQQVHVTADIAYAVWRYWDATLDEDFLAGPGSQILFETARFWVSRITRGAGSHHIRGVMGPDEYHFGVDDNAYTNYLARFNLRQAAWAAARYGRHREESQVWSELAASLYCPAPRADGVIEQFDGFFELADYPLAHDDHPRASLDRLSNREEINRRKLVKQADVLMLPLLFPDAFPDEVVAANYRYYEPLTDHGSSLSPAVHAAVAARLGLMDDAQRYFQRALRLDLSGADKSRRGVHLACMGGEWQALVFGLLGVRFTADGPRISEAARQRLPAGLRELELTLKWRGRDYVVRAGQAAAAGRQAPGRAEA